MNHIKALEQKCEITTTSYFDGRGNVTETSFDREKFAKLIIQTCIDKCEFVGTMAFVSNHNDEIARKCESTAKDCAMMIKQHFRIEK